MRDWMLEKATEKYPVILTDRFPDQVICIKQSFKDFEYAVYVPLAKARDLEREITELRSIITKIWPIVTKRTSVSFWGPIENDLRKAERRTGICGSKEGE